MRYRAAGSFPSAALAAAGRRGGEAGDRAYQDMLRDPGRAPGAGHPMLRFIADAAPQEGDAALRSGRTDEVKECHHLAVCLTNSLLHKTALAMACAGLCMGLSLQDSVWDCHINTVSNESWRCVSMLIT